jgi:cation diffusion facilitator family transporter
MTNRPARHIGLAVDTSLHLRARDNALCLSPAPPDSHLGMNSSTHDLSAWTHHHRFHETDGRAEQGTRWAMGLTAVMMVVEIIVGWSTNSMALLADGWHMSSHTLAIGLSVLAYRVARQDADNPRYAFGTWKVEVLGGFASAVCLLMVAALMVFGSVERLWSPQPIEYQEAIVVAVVGLLVNLACAALLMRAGHDHGHSHHGHGHDHGHSHDHHAHDHDHQDPAHSHAAAPEPAAAPHETDLNLRSALLHVLTDALTSVLAIGALALGWWRGWSWLDPAIGLLGAVLVAQWARGLLSQTGNVLLDREMDAPVVQEIREVIAQHGGASDTHIADLHVWRVGANAHAGALTLVTHDAALTPDTVRTWLSVHEELAHLTIEIHRCPDPAHGGPAAAV